MLTRPQADPDVVRDAFRHRPIRARLPPNPDTSCQAWRRIVRVPRSSRSEVSMRYALNLPTGGVRGDPRTLAEFAAEAEAAGWDAVLLEDYVVYQGHQDWPTCDPWVALAAMALSTERIRLGTEVTPLTRRRPWKVARETVTLDHLSNGRLVLPIGLGTLDDGGFKKVGEVTDRK